jgi:15-cis-phytoene synthase
MSETTAPTDAAALCADAVRAHDFGAYASTLFVAPEVRRALLALYAFCGELAQVHDHVSQPLPGEIRLQWWNDALTGEGHGGVEGHPVAAELKAAVATFGLPVAELTTLIEAYRGDLYDEPLPSLDALESFLGQTSSTIFALAARVCTPQHELPPDILRHAGLAEGLVSVIAQVPHHAARGRLYLPRDLLALNNVTAEQVLAGRTTDGLRAVLAYLAGEADKHLDVVRTVSLGAHPELLALALTTKTLGRLRRVDFDPFRLQPPSRLAVLWTLWRTARLTRKIS